MQPYAHTERQTNYEMLFPLNNWEVMVELNRASIYKTEQNGSMKTSAFKVIFTFSLLKELTGRSKHVVQFSEPKNIYTDTQTWSEATAIQEKACTMYQCLDLKCDEHITTKTIHNPAGEKKQQQQKNKTNK